jgi:hypothetical protein
MLIDHDFDWEADLDESPRPEDEATAAILPGPTIFPCRPGDPLRPGDGVVIIETSRGLSRGTLALAVVVLVLSAFLKLSDARHQAQAAPNDWPSVDAVNEVTNESVSEAALRGGSSDRAGRRGGDDVIEPVGRPDRAVEGKVVD